jgi:PIN domain nuclease of toxin-antitoxin system
LDEPSRLNTDARQIIDSKTEPVWVSVAGVWEAAIKQESGRLKIPERFLSISYERVHWHPRD